MSTTNGNRPRTREERVAQVFSRVTLLRRIKDFFFTEKGLKWFLFILFASIIFSVVIQSWNPPFIFRVSTRVNRDIVCSVPFSVLNPSRTQEARINARLDTPHVYEHDNSHLKQFKARLTNTVQSFLSFENYAAMKPEDQQKWHLFLPPDTKPEEAAASFTLLQKALEKDVEAKRFELALDRVFQGYEKNGILVRIHTSSNGNQEKIAVYDIDDPAKTPRLVPVRDVLLGNAYMIKDRLNQDFERRIADMLFYWIRPSIPETLIENREMTARAQNISVAAVEDVYTKFEPGQLLVKAGTVLKTDDYQLLKKEYLNGLKVRTAFQKVMRCLGAFLLIFMSLMAAYFSNHNHFMKSETAQKLYNPLFLFILLIMTVAVGRFLQISLHHQLADPELFVLILFAQTATLIYCWEIALLFAFIGTLVLVLAGTPEIGAYLMMIGTISSVIYFSRNIQKRSQLLIATFFGALIAFLFSFSIGLLREQEINRLLYESGLRMLWVLGAGFLVTGILPFLERFFGILTPMRLLELGNPSHPLLQELAARAPATYNHSIQTAAIAEAAAEAIGAKSALVRVGAYFHDIGKMISPKHFIENQLPGEENIHNSLEPRISTLVIVAHVKDGIKLGRQHHLPKEMIDLIEQHHGTMQVGFFYEKANKSSIEKYDKVLDETEFRYPGPLPKSKEAGILMLADAAESASRCIEDPTPTKIENIVRKLADRRVEDGQFDLSGLTFGELRTIEKSIINSILASKHSRIAYPQKTDNLEQSKSESAKSEQSNSENSKLENSKS